MENVRYGCKWEHLEVTIDKTDDVVVWHVHVVVFLTERVQQVHACVHDIFKECQVRQPNFVVCVEGL